MDVALLFFFFTVFIIGLLSFKTFFSTVPQGYIGVVTEFGKYRRIMGPGLNFKFPWARVRNLTTQNRAIDLQFQAITIDQANVYFNCTLLYSVADANETTIKKAAFAFASENEFLLSMQRLLEAETRAYVATKRQAEMIGVSQEVVVKIKNNVDSKLEEWGYSIHDLRYNDIRFDDMIMKSMARVVASLNERDAAENEGQALLIRKTKEAEANGAFIKINAEAEREAWRLRGQGLAQFRAEVAKGIHVAVEELQQSGIDPNYLLFFMYTETIKHVAENARAGHTIFVSTSPTAPRDLMEQMAGFYKTSNINIPESEKPTPVVTPTPVTTSTATPLTSPVQTPVPIPRK
jgi:regulator of protease activity HflC (stomatin/prohibitin superfamily)